MLYPQSPKVSPQDNYKGKCLISLWRSPANLSFSKRSNGSTRTGRTQPPLRGSCGNCTTGAQSGDAADRPTVARGPRGDIETLPERRD